MEKGMLMIMAIALLSTNAYAEYYVSPQGASAWPSCQMTSPCSLASANSNAQAGDTIMLMPGTYSQSIEPARNGSSGRRITFEAQGDAIFTKAPAVKFDARSHITVKGIVARTSECRSTCYASFRYSQHNILEDSVMDSPGTQSSWTVGVTMYKSSRYNIIRNNTIGNVGYSSNGDDIGGVMNVGSWSDPDERTAFNLIEANRLFHGGHHVVELASSDNIFRNNHFHNENWNSCGTGMCGNRNIVIATDYPHNSVRNIMEGNIFSFSGTPDDSLTSSGVSVRTRYNIVRMNSFYHNDGPGITMYADGRTWYDAEFNWIYGNVFYRNGHAKIPLTGADKRYWTGITFDKVSSGGYPIANNSLKNNIFYANKENDLYFYYTPVAWQQIEGNYYKAAYEHPPGKSPSMPGNIVSAGDPGFIDIQSQFTPGGDPPDFRLLAQSPAIDAGVFLTRTSGSGAGTKIRLQESGYFTDGKGLVPGDLVQLENDTAIARIIGIDYSLHEITLDRSLSWLDGQGISLPYSGARPDIGIHESDGTSPVCGDAVCYLETCASCPADCGPCLCGNNVCDAAESCVSCPSDCVKAHMADDSPCDGRISGLELSAFISLWKKGSVSGLMTLMEAIGIWKS